MQIVVMVDGKPKGPFELEALKQAIQEGTISLSALAWYEGREDWTELQNIPELQSITIPPPNNPNEIELKDGTEVKWHYRSGKSTLGPATTKGIRTLLASGAISASTQICRDDSGTWVNIGSVPAFQEIGSPPLNESAQTKAPGTAVRNPSKGQFSIKLLLAAATCIIVFAGLGFWYSRHKAHLVYVQKLQHEQEAAKLSHERELKAAQQAATEAEQRSLNQQQIEEQRAAQAEQEQVANAELAKKARLEAQRTSMDKWINLVEAAIQSQQRFVAEDQRRQGLTRRFITSTVGKSPEYLNARHAVKGALENPTGSLGEFPEPIVGNKEKVSDVQHYIQEKLHNPQEGSGHELAYDTRSQLWVLRSQSEGYLFQMSDLDPTSGQVVTKAERNVFNDQLTGRSMYFLHFTTRNNKNRIIIYNAYGMTTINSIDLFCGYGPGDLEVERIGKALTALIVAYGGKEEMF